MREMEADPISDLHLPMHQKIGTGVETDKRIDNTRKLYILYIEILNLHIETHCRQAVCMYNTQIYFKHNKSTMAASVQIMYTYTNSTRASSFWGNKICAVPTFSYFVQLLDKLYISWNTDFTLRISGLQIYISSIISSIRGGDTTHFIRANNS